MKTLVIASASMKKINKRCKAKEMYTGPLFRNVRELCEKKGYDYVIISLKYGLLFPDQVISPYKSFETKETTIKDLSSKVIPRLEKILPKYQKVIVLAGKRYRDLLTPAWDERFSYVESSGYGDLQGKIRKMINEKSTT